MFAATKLPMQRQAGVKQTLTDRAERNLGEMLEETVRRGGDQSTTMVHWPIMGFLATSPTAGRRWLLYPSTTGDRASCAILEARSRANGAREAVNGLRQANGVSRGSWVGW